MHIEVALNLPLVLRLGLPLLATLPLIGCDVGWGRADYDRQIEVCSLAERNGLPDQAAEACGTALSIALDKGFPAEEVALLQFRLGRLERQRGEFTAAEILAHAALLQAEAAGDPASVARRSVELALSLAGQDRWLEGFAALERAAPVLGTLTGEDLPSARSAARLFAVRLDLLGHSGEAARCRRLAEALVEPGT